MKTRRNNTEYREFIRRNVNKHPVVAVEETAEDEDQETMESMGDLYPLPKLEEDLD